MYGVIPQADLLGYMYMWVYAADNNVKSLEGIGKLEKLISFRFDANYIESL